MCQHFIQIDLFGRQLGLSLNGRKKLKTLPGALLSSMLIIAVLSILIERLLEFYTYSDLKFSQMTIDGDIDGLGPLSLENMGTDIQIGFYSVIDDQFVQLDPRIGSVEVRATLFNETAGAA